MASSSDHAQATESSTGSGNKPVKLTDLIAAARHDYAVKRYDDAAEKFSDATALQAEVNGEMNPENADLLYEYGRCLYKVAVSKSDVLGGKVAGEESKSKSKKRKRGADVQAKASGSAGTTQDEAAAGEVLQAIVDKREGVEVKSDAEETKADPKDSASKPYFQIAGDDADWDDSDEEDVEGEEGEDAGEGGEEEEDDDDFAVAYEILDLARVLLTRKIEAQRDVGKGKGEESPETRQAREKLADTLDLQLEISLENERFEDAIHDGQASLDLKLDIYPKESALVAEAHYKLSLAYEFASTSYLKTDGPPEEATKGQTVDESKREEAAKHMEAAIESSRLRVQKESASVSSLPAEDAKKSQAQIDDVREMISEMEQRLEDLRNPAVDINSMTGPAGAPDGSNPLGGLLGSILGESPADQKARIQEATKNANDLSGLVRHKKKPQPPAVVSSTNGKRAAQDDDAASTSSKKAKVEGAE